MVQVKLFQSVFCYFDEIVKGMLTKITADAASLPKKSVNATAIIQIRVFRFLQFAGRLLHAPVPGSPPTEQVAIFFWQPSNFDKMIGHVTCL